MLMLVGSTALRLRAPTLLVREPRDLDGIGTFDLVQRALKREHRRQPFQSILPAHGAKKMIGYRPGSPWEFEIAWEDSTGADLLKLVAEDPQTMHGNGYLSGVMVPSLDVLYTLKMSHRYLKNSPHFLKTMADIRAMRKAAAQIPERYQVWYKARMKDTYSYGHPNLNQTKMGFFSGDGVKYVFDHDSIHVAMAVHERPAYTFYQKDGSEVLCDRNKWEALPEAYRIAGVLEESYVLALERSQVPHPNKLTPRQSFEKALGKVCTSITSGWFREYAWEHYDEVLQAYDPTYADRFWAAVKTGVVKKLN
jgi:hypothetical protein